MPAEYSLHDHCNPTYNLTLALSATMTIICNSTDNPNANRDCNPNRNPNTNPNRMQARKLLADMLITEHFPDG